MAIVADSSRAGGETLTKAELAKTIGALECLIRTTLLTSVQEQTYMDKRAGDHQFKRRSCTASEKFRIRTSEGQEERRR